MTASLPEVFTPSSQAPPFPPFKKLTYLTNRSNSIQSPSCEFHGGVPERPKGADCKSAGDAYGGSNPPPSTILRSEAYVKSHAPELRMASQFERRMSDVAREEIVYRVVGEGGQFGYRSKA